MDAPTPATRDAPDRAPTAARFTLRDARDRTLRFTLFGLLAGAVLFVLSALDSLFGLALHLHGAGAWARFLALLALTVPGTGLLGLALGALASLLEAARARVTASLDRLPLRLAPRVKEAAGLTLASIALAIPLDLLTGLSPRGPKAVMRAAVTGYHLYVQPIPFLVAHWKAVYSLGLALLVLGLMGAGAWISRPRGRFTRPLAAVVTLALSTAVGLAYLHDSRPSYGHNEHTLHDPLVVAYSLLAIYATGFAARAVGAMDGAPGGSLRSQRLLVGLAALGALILAHAQVGMDASQSVKALFWNRSVIARRHAELGRSLWDRDHDGASPLFGGDDPDDHDASVGPSAREVPGNGVDDNGIGGDLDPGALTAVPRAPRPGELVPPAPPLDAAWNPREAPAGAVDVAAPDAIGKADAGGERLNVILISVDALRADRLGLYGNPRPTSPNLDRWAKKGLTFTRALSQATNTGHSFCSLLRSSYGDAVMDPNVPTLTQLLEKGGYHTAFVNSRRLDDWLLQKRWQPYRATMTADFDVLHLDGGTWWTAEELTDRMIAYVDRLPAGRPEMIWAHYNDTHEPRVPRTTFGTSALDVYDAAVAFTDAQIGRLLDHLDQRGWLRRSIVFITADHGESFFEHGTFDHSNKPYLDNDHVPLIVLAPGLAPVTITTAVGLIDVTPTALAAAGLASPSLYRGIDLLAAARLPVFPERAIITEPPRNDPEAAFFAWAYVEGHFKLLYDRKGMTRELYDLDRDPHEQDDLIDRDPGRARAMSAGLGRFLDLESNRRAAGGPLR